MKYLWIVAILSYAHAFDISREEVRKELELLKKDPQAYYHRMPTKEFVTNSLNPFPYKKIDYRDQYFPLPPMFTEQIDENGNAKSMVWEPEKYIRNFKSINGRGLYRRTVSKDPWTGHFFPIYRGMIAQRYADKGFTDNDDTWFRAYRYVRQNTASEIYSSGDVEKINQLSPAEKYDLIMGTDFTLTSKMWEAGKKFFERDGKVETWMGMCHGWAPASFTLNRPISTITIPSAKKGIPITFYPADIKALATALYANTRFALKFTGVRCDETNPGGAGEDRPEQKECRDVNPGSFHLALANQIGITGSPVIMDTAYDFEVWNAPITSYKFLYFNPITKKVPRYMKDAVVDARDFRWSRPGDPYGHHRSAEAEYIVGVTATITYESETWADQSETNGPADDRYNRIIYTYDLELDKDYNIIGGEWYQNKHPDFLWTPKENIDVVTEGDIRLLDEPMWNMKNKVTPAFAKEAKVVSEKHAAPLALVVQRMIEMSRTEE